MNTFSFGFTFMTERYGTQKPQCILCGKVLANRSMKPLNLKDHLNSMFLLFSCCVCAQKLLLCATDHELQGVMTKKKQGLHMVWFVNFKMMTKKGGLFRNFKLMSMEKKYSTTTQKLHISAVSAAQTFIANANDL